MNINAKIAIDKTANKALTDTGKIMTDNRGGMIIQIRIVVPPFLVPKLSDGGK
ncbi:MAG: hypothetical protein HRT90_11860 [Candidatus Margulisbacteria bacterium]|nr:hypothetical protein [Candidatus Margulisiibacteriota bacterium]